MFWMSTVGRVFASENVVYLKICNTRKLTTQYENDVKELELEEH